MRSENLNEDRSIMKGEELLQTEFCKLGLQFCGAMCREMYAEAHAMLTPRLQHALSVDKLQGDYLVSTRWRAVERLEPQAGLTDFENQLPGDLGAVFIGLMGQRFGVLFRAYVCHQNGPYKIRELQWSQVWDDDDWIDNNECQAAIIDLPRL